ncbi:hypothetical protein BU26DRAFT_560770 [Trematosphaeria pertusa]|uniref:Uncharacterized protein n=1 Tax=Trematosphaeria pertusa TaxID=390896 RepID=A0A6A6IV34_9PLEO|nr:uncharacterized protein BU26DRAFT_560770 [Trematosphaeria pertusa]KAF2253470.1 hypothetical protein BU26DRAFT_560770 [Trematosphaeria pertusa]
MAARRLDSPTAVSPSSSSCGRQRSSMTPNPPSTARIVPPTEQNQFLATLFSYFPLPPPAPTPLDRVLFIPYCVLAIYFLDIQLIVGGLTLVMLLMAGLYFAWMSYCHVKGFVVMGYEGAMECYRWESFWEREEG